MLLSLLACSVETHMTEVPPGTLRGHVFLDDGTPVASVEVGVMADTFVTDVEGAFEIAGLPAGEVAYTLRSETTSFGQGTVMIEAGETTEANFQVLPLRDATLADGAAGGTVTTDDGLELVFPPNALVDANGALVTGPVQIDYALLNTAVAVLAAPGGLLTTGPDGDLVPLVSNGMVDLRLSQGGLEVQPVSPVTLSFPTIGTTAPCGESFDLYRFDQGDAVWKLEGGGRLDGDRFVATIESFAYWNCDVPTSGDGCIDVTLHRDGEPFALREVGVYLSNGTAAMPTTDALGAIRVSVAEGAFVTVGVVFDAFGNARAEAADAIWSLGPIEVPEAADGCADLGVVEVTGVDVDDDGYGIAPWGWECFDDDPATTTDCEGHAAGTGGTDEDTGAVDDCR